jgi:DNA repair protein RadC
MHAPHDPTPSAEDGAVTRQLAAAGATLGIEVLDHIIVGDAPHYVSLVEAGLMETAMATGRASA